MHFKWIPFIKSFNTTSIRTCKGRNSIIFGMFLSSQLLEVSQFYLLLSFYFKANKEKRAEKKNKGKKYKKLKSQIFLDDKNSNSNFMVWISMNPKRNFIENDVGKNCTTKSHSLWQISYFTFSGKFVLNFFHMLHKGIFSMKYSNVCVSIEIFELSQVHNNFGTNIIYSLLKIMFKAPLLNSWNFQAKNGEHLINSLQKLRYFSN